MGERGEGAREPGSQTPPAGKEQTREVEGAGWVEMRENRDNQRSKSPADEWEKDRGRKERRPKDAPSAAREAPDTKAGKGACGVLAGREDARGALRGLPVLPPPWLPLSGGKMPEHFSHSTWPAKHSSVTMCSAFWHRLLTPSSLWKLIVWPIFPQLADFSPLAVTYRPTPLAP